jgi:hypothetical protein
MEERSRITGRSLQIQFEPNRDASSRLTDVYRRIIDCHDDSETVQDPVFQPNEKALIEEVAA